MWPLSGRYLRERSVMIHWRSTTSNNTDHTKVLQMDTFKTMRAMRAVFCQLLRYWIIVLSSLGILIRRPEFLKGVLNALVADERTIDGPGT
jgi:hypothetical protein